MGTFGRNKKKINANFFYLWLMFTEEHIYAIALRRCRLVGDVNFHKLVKTAGSAKEAWIHAKKLINKIDGIGKKISSDIGNEEHLRFAEKEIKFCEKNKINILLRHQSELPKLLSECADAPAILYQKGSFNENLRKLSVVGTRNITHYGKQFIHDFFTQLPSKMLVSVSGLALGVDKEVHEQSLENNIPTVAVLAHGFHTLYPEKNRRLAENILENNGALLSEFNSSHKPDREHFLQRNRIIAGLSSATIVVETGFGGGSLSTATHANGYNRDIYALPGKITDKYSQGCNLLIEQNKASSISTINKLIDVLGLEKEVVKQGSLFPKSEIILQMTVNQKEIFEILSKNANINLDEISSKTGMPSQKVATILLELELLGLVKSLSGKRYVIE